MKRPKAHLKWWNRDVFGNIFDNIKNLEEKVSMAESCFEQDPSQNIRASLSLVHTSLNQALNFEELFWKQKASARWLVEGERNTKLFHNMVNRKRSASKIHRIWDNGVCLENYGLIQESGAKFFEQLLTGEDTCLNLANPDIIPLLISESNNSMLLQLPTSDEIKSVILSTSTDSAAGLDGYSVQFFASCWDIIKFDVTHAIQEIFNGAELPKSFIATTIVLILKSEAMQSWRDFRPINLCKLHQQDNLQDYYRTYFIVLA